ncbi:hypothetical protein CMO87_01870 [Candidatus Woesearchaeota archaeon]|jgi:Na+/melibiose symporter-like transporter|nr:hypothetical protein [Candidatus Woesearchaeota archaeon]MAH01956.1 hypothetical protein [Candidatus Woesearchaeota archaeon]MDP6547454.1 hypothetical protein [Candidatus Woesearchaeota archaeon]|tara:strand:- start:5667 stop:5948 length:282 start_codon:yes stop_codon:yes gene_type:complete
MVEVRKTSSFEKMLLIVGLLVLIIGYMLISKAYTVEGGQLSWDFLQTTFLWLLIVIFIIVLAIGEDIKEGILIEQLNELKSIKKSLLKGKKKG